MCVCVFVWLVGHLGHLLSPKTCPRYIYKDDTRELLLGVPGSRFWNPWCSHWVPGGALWAPWNLFWAPRAPSWPQDGPEVQKSSKRVPALPCPTLSSGIIFGHFWEPFRFVLPSRGVQSSKIYDFYGVWFQGLLFSTIFDDFEWVLESLFFFFSQRRQVQC